MPSIPFFELEEKNILIIFYVFSNHSVHFSGDRVRYVGASVHVEADHR